MSKFFHLAKRATTTPKTNQRSNQRLHVSLPVLNSAVFALVFCLGVSSLLQVNSLATKGYTIRELEVKIDQLEADGNDLELEVLELQAMDTVKSKVSQLNMVTADTVDYLSPTPVALAR